MRYYSVVASVAALVAASTAPAFARDSATLRLVAYVPVRCDAAPMSAFITEDQLVINVRRSCNTGHAVTITGRDVEGLGDVTITESRTGRTKTGTEAVFGQPEAVFSGTDQFVITARHSSPEALLRYGQSLMVGVEVT